MNSRSPWMARTRWVIAVIGVFTAASLGGVSAGWAQQTGLVPVQSPPTRWADNQLALPIPESPQSLPSMDFREEHSLSFDLDEENIECAGGVCSIGPAVGDCELTTAAAQQVETFADATPVADPLAHALQPLATAASPRPALNWQRLTSEPVTTALLSLGIVIGVYFILRLVWRTQSKAAAAGGSGPVIEVVGRVPLGSGQQLQLIRLATRLVLICVSSKGAEPLAEITDPDEVDQILEACRSGGPTLAGALNRLSRRTPAAQRQQVGVRPSPRAVFEA